MELKLSVPAEYIGVLKLFAAKNAVQYYLNGIALEIGPTESRLIATDGHRLGVFRVESDQPTVSKILTDIIIPIELLEGIKPKAVLEVLITVGPQEPHSKSRPVSLWQDGKTISGQTIDGQYIDHRRVIPRGEVSGVPAQFSPVYIGDLAKASRILHGKHANWVGIGHNGDSGALIHFGCDANFVGVIMPMRGDAPKSAPAWAFGDLRADVPQAKAA